MLSFRTGCPGRGDTLRGFPFYQVETVHDRFLCVVGQLALSHWKKLPGRAGGCLLRDDVDMRYLCLSWDMRILAGLPVSMSLVRLVVGCGMRSAECRANKDLPI
jgi:hypothetical protein